MKLKECKCGCQKPERKVGKSDNDKSLYFIECPKCGSKTGNHFGAYKQIAAKEWNVMQAVVE